MASSSLQRRECVPSHCVSFMLKTHQANFCAPIRVSYAVEIENSEIGLMRFDPSSSLQMMHRQKCNVEAARGILLGHLFATVGSLWGLHCETIILIRLLAN